MRVDPDRLSRLVLYLRQGCHLCDQFLLDLALELGPDVEQLRIEDVDRDADLAVRFGLRVPVLEFDGTVIAEAHLDAPRLRVALGL